MSLLKKLTPPSDPKDNLIYRHAVRSWAKKSQGNVDLLMDRCRDDVLFWMKTFAYVMEPRPDRKRKAKILPFIPWPHQEPMIQVIQDNMGMRDIGVTKSRGEGATWVAILMILHRWIYGEFEVFGMVSRTQLTADNPEDPDSLGWKLDWEIKQLPRWMVGEPNVDYKRNITKHTWWNLRNESSITAYPAIGEFATGGRKTLIFMDEFSKFAKGEDENALASSEPACDGRLIVSTYKGTDNAYYRCMNSESNMIKVSLDWKKNPTRNKDMFRIDMAKGRLLHNERDEEVFPEYTKEFFSSVVNKLMRHGYPVNDRKKIWSKWYIYHCLRVGMTPTKMAQEYDMDPGGTESRFFPRETIDFLVESARPPMIQGDFMYKSDKCVFDRFSESKSGSMKLWTKLRGKNPPPGNYVIGCDIATGIGGTMSSNSTLSIVDRSTGIKVGEFASPVIKPEDFAKMVVSVCRWFADEDGLPAFLVFERNGGHGASFRNTIIDETTFRNMYFRTSRTVIYSKSSKEPGFWSGRTEKQEILSKYRWALAEGHFTNLSEIALEECLHYYTLPNGKVDYVEVGASVVDPANSGENHGDRVIADALALFGVESLSGSTEPTEVDELRNEKKMYEPPVGSFRWRQLKSQKEAKKRLIRREW